MRRTIVADHRCYKEMPDAGGYNVGDRKTCSCGREYVVRLRTVFGGLIAMKYWALLK